MIFASVTVWAYSLFHGCEFNHCQIQRDVLLNHKQIRNSDLQSPDPQIAK